MSISTDAVKIFDKFQHQFITEALSALERDGNFLSLIKSIYRVLTASG